MVVSKRIIVKLFIKIIKKFHLFLTMLTKVNNYTIP